MIPSDMKSCELHFCMGGRRYMTRDIVNGVYSGFSPPIYGCFVFSPLLSLYKENVDTKCGSDHVGGGPLV